MKVRLKDAFDLQMGKTPARNMPAYWDGEHKWISIADIGCSGKYITTTKERITDKAITESGIRAVPARTVIMSFKLSIGKTAITSEEMYTNEAIMAFVNKETYDIDTDYLYHLCCGTEWTEGTNKAVMGLTLNKATLSEKRISLPEISEQRSIAAKFDELDSIIEKTQAELSALDQLVKSRFIEMFGDLANPACEWPQVKLVEACADPDDIKCGPFGTQLSKDEYRHEGIALWEIPQINMQFRAKPTHYLDCDKAAELDAYSIRPGDIAMSRKGNVGRCAVFPDNYVPGIIHSDVLRIRMDSGKVAPVFMMYQLHYSGGVQRQIEQVSSGAIMAGINVTKLKSITVHLPPLELQNHFATLVAQTDKSKFRIQKSLSTSRKLWTMAQIDAIMNMDFSTQRSL